MFWFSDKLIPFIKVHTERWSYFQKWLSWCITIYGSSIETFSHELKLLFLRYFGNVKLNVMMVNSFKIGLLFPHKDRFTKHLRSSIDYELCCVFCASASVVMTTRNQSIVFKASVREIIMHSASPFYDSLSCGGVLGLISDQKFN